MKLLIEHCWHPEPEQRPDFTHIVAALDIIIVESAIDDALGRQFWKQSFLKRDPVPWMELLLERRELAAAGPLNLRPREKWLTLLAALAAGMALGSLVLRSPRVGGVAAQLSTGCAC